MTTAIEIKKAINDGSIKNLSLDEVKNLIEDLSNSSKYDLMILVVKNYFGLQLTELTRTTIQVTMNNQKIDVAKFKMALKRKGNAYVFDFTQSIVNSGRLDVGKRGTSLRIDINKAIVPTLYDVLTCLQKYEVGSFEDFCSDFGYDEDSRTAEKTYKAVVKEFEGVQELFNSEELEVLQYIQ